ncbi:MAG: DoxX family protein [Chloroflexi bacterium]|nr:DoxX family protein [Chloroflexota bacterium]
MNRLRVLTEPSRVASDIGLLVLRLAVAAVFIAHGWGDVFGAGVSTNIQNFRDAGIPLPALAAPYTAYIQLFGGIAFVFGALTRPLSAGFIVVMAGALIFVHRGEPLVMQPDGSGSGFAFIMCMAATALLLLGPGRFSADSLIAERQAGPARTVEGG